MAYMAAVCGRILGARLTQQGVMQSRGFSTPGAPGAMKEAKGSQVQLAAVLAIGAAGAYYLFGDGFRSHRSEVSSGDPGSGAAKRQRVAPSEGVTTHAPGARVQEDAGVSTPK